MALGVVPGPVLSVSKNFMLDPRRRLQRTVPGERFHQVSEEDSRVFARAESGVQEKRWSELVPARMGARATVERVNRCMVDPSPNAPLLIRLARRKAMLEPGEFVKRPELHIVPVRDERVPLEQPMRAARAQAPTSIRLRPMSLHPRVRSPDRASAADWIAGLEDGVSR